MIKRKSGASTEGGRITIDITLSASIGRTDDAGRASRPTDADVVANYFADMIANYLADMIDQLEDLARAANQDMVAYLLSRASVQAATPEARWDRPNALH